MGKWNRRYLYLPRSKHRNYDYEDPPLDDPSNSSGSWEIDYCKSAKVPWNKVLASKKYIYCYPSVLHWDASASKEALENAKQRYWAMINGLPCNNPLPDPDMYIHDIDWNADVDPELMEDLDLQFFNPDEGCSVDRLETVKEEAASCEVHNNKDQFTTKNPWEINIVQGSGSLKDPAKGWGRWGDSINLKNENPWEKSCNQVVDSVKDNGWKTGNESAEGWGQRDINYQGWNERNASGQQLRGSGSYGYSWENKNHAVSKGRGWADNGNQFSGWRGSEFQAGVTNGWDSSNFKRSGTSFRGDNRKRESSVQHTPKYKSSRYQSYT